jgi:hypothetical protein
MVVLNSNFEDTHEVCSSFESYFPTQSRKKKIMKMLFFFFFGGGGGLNGY